MNEKALHGQVQALRDERVKLSRQLNEKELLIQKSDQQICECIRENRALQANLVVIQQTNSELTRQIIEIQDASLIVENANMHLIADIRRAEIEIQTLNARLGAANQEKAFYESQVIELNRKVR